MIDKDYLKKLKEEDYTAWHDLMNDPMVVGQDTGVGCAILLAIMVLLVCIGYTIAYWI